MKISFQQLWIKVRLPKKYLVVVLHVVGCSGLFCILLAFTFLLFGLENCTSGIACKKSMIFKRGPSFHLLPVIFRKEKYPPNGGIQLYFYVFWWNKCNGIGFSFVLVLRLLQSENVLFAEVLLMSDK